MNYDYDDDLKMARAGIKIDYEHHVALFLSASLLEIDGPIAFVHAGVNPERSVNNQERSDCLSIRKPFLDYSGHPISLYKDIPSRTGDARS